MKSAVFFSLSSAALASALDANKFKAFPEGVKILMVVALCIAIVGLWWSILPIIFGRDLPDEDDHRD